VYQRAVGSKFTTHRADSILSTYLTRPRRIFFDPAILGYVSVDLTDWACRDHYFTGRYFDPLVPAAIARLLAKGGTFIDVGANRGLHSLHAAKVLEKNGGTVHAFEPNPKTFEVLTAHLLINGISNCRAYNLGVADKPGELVLRVPEAHSGMASFCDIGPADQEVVVSVKTLDEFFSDASPEPPVLVKIDTEGFELQVLRGMESLLQRDGVFVLCEVTDRWLRKTGGSAEMLLQFMAERGYRSYFCDTSHKPPHLKPVMRLREIMAPEESIRQYDVLFSKTGLS
jgi:FkbM family methyltransferase